MLSRSRTAQCNNAILLPFAVIASLATTVLMASALAQAPLEKPSSGLINPRAIAYSTASRKIYAVDSGHGSVQVYDEAAHDPRSVKVGSEPISIAADAKSGRVYVANSGDGSVTVLDGTSDSVIATIPVGSHPYSIAANAVTGKIYVTHTFGNQLTVIDASTNTATDLKTGSSDLIAIDSRANTIYLLGYGGAVKVLNGANDKLVERPIGDHGWALTLDDANGEVYATRIESSDVAVLNVSGTLTFLPVGAIPCAIAINSRADIIYVANFGDNTVSVIDGKSRSMIATVAVGDHPKAIAYDSMRNLVYVANTLGNSVTVIDASTNVVTATLPAGKAPYALAIVPSGSRLYVANESDESPSTSVDINGIRP